MIRKARILIVDDDAPMAEAFAAGLRAAGYQCEIAGSTDDADQVLQREEVVDLTLLDITMPDKTGLSFLPELTERCPDMAVVMVTGLDELDTAVFAMREGADDYLAKPVPMGLLIDRVGKALWRRALFRENKAYREFLELMVRELNMRLEESRDMMAASNTLIQAFVLREQNTPKEFADLGSTVEAFRSGIESLTRFARGIYTEDRQPDSTLR